MKRSSKTIGLLLVTALVAMSLLPVSALAQHPQSLILVTWRSDDDLTRIEASGVTVFARMTAGEAPGFLAGSMAKQMAALQDDGLSVRLLDPSIEGAAYYVAHLAPNRPRLDWSAYGQVLLEDGGQVVLRTTTGEAERLSEAGAVVVAVTLTPKPVRTAAPGGGFPSAVDWDPMVQAMIDQVQSATVSEYDRQLAGELPVWVDGAWYTIPSRYTYSGTPIQKATSWIGQRFAAQGLEVEYHNWGGATYPNVIAQRDGLIDPENIFIIGGHVDDVQGTPGADDNASGSVAAMIAADIMTQYQWGCTLRFAVWTGEEQGLNGSEAYAQRAYNNGENIVGYLNLDMIAWNTPSSQPGIDLYYSTSIPPTLQLAQLMADVIDTYSLDLIPQLGTGVTGSDHASFWQYGYTAILGIEDNGDFNPYYHGPGDTPAHTDLTFFTNFVKASVATYAHMTGCLIPGGTGTLEGHVTAAAGGAPISGATVTITDPDNHTIVAVTDANGFYSKTLMPNTYTVDVSAYGYLPQTATGVVVTADNTTVQDFALQSAPIYTVQGTVTEVGTGAPLYAHVTFEGSPVEAWSDPATGYYEASLPQGDYVMHVTADVHRPAQRPIALDGNQIQDFALEPLPCILLVDDDNDAPDTRGYFSAALDALGYDYDVFDVGGGGNNGPTLEGLQGYNMVFWFTGDAYGGSAGPNGEDEAALTAYLDGGGRLFLSAQDYLYDYGVTTFGATYLGIGNFVNDSGNATTKYGVAGDPIGGGLGPYALTYPSGFTDYGDIVNAGNGASVAFRAASGGGNNLDVDKAAGDWKTVFFGTDWVPVYNNNAANGRQLLQRIIDWFGGCEEPCDPVHDAEFTWTPPAPQAGQEVTFEATAAGDPPIAYDWTFGDGTQGSGATVAHTYGDPGDYTVTLTASNNCGQQVIEHVVSVSPAHSLHINLMKGNWAAPVPPYYKIVVSLRIHDEAHAVAPGATVLGQWTMPNGRVQNRQAGTDALGRAKFQLKSAQCGVFQLCVTDVTKAGYVYNPAANEQGPCKQVTVPCE